MLEDVAMLVSMILKTKGDMVFTIAPDETIAAAAEILAARRVGALVVLEEGEVVGILSERDVVRLVAQEGAAALRRPIAACMTSQVIFARPDEDVDTLLSRMSDRRIRHLPVCIARRLVGIISIGDLVHSKIAEVEAEAAGLKAYIVAG